MRIIPTPHGGGSARLRHLPGGLCTPTPGTRSTTRWPRCRRSWRRWLRWASRRWVCRTTATWPRAWSCTRRAGRHGITPFPGSEMYFVPDTAAVPRGPCEQGRQGHDVPHGCARVHHAGLRATWSTCPRCATATTTTSRWWTTRCWPSWPRMGGPRGWRSTPAATSATWPRRCCTRVRTPALQFLYTLSDVVPRTRCTWRSRTTTSPTTRGRRTMNWQTAWWRLADQAGLPVVITQDSHYLDARRPSRPRRAQAARRLRT